MTKRFDTFSHCCSEGFLITGEFGNGVAAISLALKHQPDFMILDHRMPCLDGKATAEVLRAVAPNARVVAFSAVLDGKPEWADAYLNKQRIAEIAPLLTALIPAGQLVRAVRWMTEPTLSIYDNCRTPIDEEGRAYERASDS